MFIKILSASLVVLQILTQSASAFEFQPVIQPIAVQLIPAVSLQISSATLKNKIPDRGESAFLFFKAADSFVNQPLAFGQGLSVYSGVIAGQTLSNPAGWRLTGAYLRALSQVKRESTAPSSHRIYRVNPVDSGLLSFPCVSMINPQIKSICGFIMMIGQGKVNKAFNLYGYNNRSELTGSNRYLGTNITILTSPVTAETRAFTYDPIGNRTNITVATNNGTYSANNLNQYSTENIAGGGANTFTHDFDGNLTQISGNKNVQYTYNAENQLISAAPTTPALNDKKVDAIYDYQGRRVQKTISNWTGLAWVPLTTKRFVYDGWNVLEEQTVAGLSKYYVWGLDLSQSLQGAGGVGGLLAKVEGTTTHHYFYDGNGNVGQMVNASGGAVDAQYEYDPYGNSIVATGSQAAGNSYRFSTKYLDTEFNFYYYGYRFYDPATGRWVNRDPIGEEGGLNLYGLVNNKPINAYDYLGLWSLRTSLIGTAVHQKFTAWGRRTFREEGYIFDTEFASAGLALGSRRHVDALDPFGEAKNNFLGRIWDLKPDSHENPSYYATDDAQLRLYLDILNHPENIAFRKANGLNFCNTFEIGEPTDLVTERKYLGEIEVLLKKYNVYMYPSNRKGLIFYSVYDKEEEDDFDRIWNGKTSGSTSNSNSNPNNVGLSSGFRVEFPGNPGFVGDMLKNR